nr:hypothetical protein [Tanacetum cinerariifolium]
MAPKRTTRSTHVLPVTPAPTATTTTIIEAQLQALINQGVAAAMAEAEASRVRNGYGSNGSGPRLIRSYMVELSFEDCYSGSCSGLPWKTLKKMMTDKVEKYIGGLPDTIHDSVKATKPKTMQEAIEFATELMDKRIRDAIENKRKFEVTSGNNQNQPQQNKRQNTCRAYAAGNSDKNMYTGSKPLCSKCDYHHEGPCPPRCNNCKRVGHLTRDCRRRPANANNNNTNNKNRNNNNTNNNNRNNNNNNNQKGNGMDWLSRYNAVIACVEKLVRIPFGNEIITIRGEGSNERNES